MPSLPVINFSTIPNFHLFRSLLSSLIMHTSPRWTRQGVSLCARMWRSRKPRSCSHVHLAHNASLHFFSYLTRFLSRGSSSWYASLSGNKFVWLSSIEFGVKMRNCSSSSTNFKFQNPGLENLENMFWSLKVLEN